MASAIFASLTVAFMTFCFIQQSQAAFIQKVLTFDNCSPGSVFNVKQIDVDPYPPSPGDTVAVKASFTSSQEVQSGSVHVRVQGTGSLNFVNLEKTYDLCSVVPTRCPIKEGATSISISRELPDVPISGTFNVQIEATGEGGESLLCAQLPLEIA